VLVRATPSRKAPMKKVRKPMPGSAESTNGTIISSGLAAMRIAL
jgi:hypothetical protein